MIWNSVGSACREKVLHLLDATRLHVTGHKRRMVFFGGCDDNDLQEEIQSGFNDLHAYDMDLGRFFKLDCVEIRQKKKK